MTNLYSLTVVPDSPWKRMASDRRTWLITGLWLVTWALLVLGFVDRTYWQWVVAFSAAHSVFVWAMVGFRALAFPAQLRITHTAWLALGTFVPQLEGMMPITTVGIAALFVFGYCPLARMIYLLPWNRTVALSTRVVLRTFLQPPGAGRFAVEPQPLKHSTRVAVAAHGLPCPCSPTGAAEGHDSVGARRRPVARRSAGVAARSQSVLQDRARISSITLSNFNSLWA